MYTHSNFKTDKGKELMKIRISAQNKQQKVPISRTILGTGVDHKLEKLRRFARKMGTKKQVNAPLLPLKVAGKTPAQVISLR